MPVQQSTTDSAAEGRARGLLQEEIELWSGVKRRNSATLVIIGQQHQGKSSLANSLNRLLRGRPDIPDQLMTSFTGNEENTIETQELIVPFNSFEFRLLDTPAVHNLRAERRNQLNALLAQHIGNGVRRDGLQEALWRVGRHWFHGTVPADAVLVVVSLTSYKASADEVKGYLGKLYEVLKNVSDCVDFPRALVLTHTDAFLASEGATQADLEEAKIDLAEAAGIKNVICVSQVEEDVAWNSKVATTWFKMLRTLLAQSKHKNTAKGQESKQFRMKLAAGAMTALSFALLMGMGSRTS